MYSGSGNILTWPSWYIVKLKPGHVSYVMMNLIKANLLQSKLHSITPVATKVHVILRGYVVLTLMSDILELV